MSLPAPNLDTRSFQSIVDDVKRQIGLRCPEWTDHNVSDPGVTLIELFAYMTEMMLFQANQVPERNYIKFLELLGVRLDMREAARTDLRFRLSKPIEDEESETRTVTIERDTLAGTLRTEAEESIEFATDFELELARPKLKYVFSKSKIRGAEDYDFELGIPDGGRNAQPDARRSQYRFLIYGNGKPLTEDECACYFGFEQDISGHIVRLHAACDKAGATNLRPEYPSQIWQYWDSADQVWSRIEPITDSTMGFSRDGYVELEIPFGLERSKIDDRRAFWVRCVYTNDETVLPPRGPKRLTPSDYHGSPWVRGISAQTTGGFVPASNCSRVYNEVIGESDGTPGQRFYVRNVPMLALQDHEVVRVGPSDGETPFDEWQVYTRVDDFSESKKEDFHFACDPLTGEISFAPVFVSPSGEVEQYGVVPPEGYSVAISSYRFGGGLSGNVRENTVVVDKASLPGISEIRNPRPAVGGTDMESIERAKMTALKLLKTRNRAVTAGDFESLALEKKGIARAHCVPAGEVGSRYMGTPGVVSVYLIPNFGDIAWPRFQDLQTPTRLIEEVSQHLDEARLLTSILRLRDPEYIFVSTELRIVADPRADADQVATRVRERLARFIHPLYGGPNGKGWPFGQTLSLSDVYAQVHDVGGVAFLLDGAKIFRSEVVNDVEGLLSPERLVSNRRGLPLLPHQMFVSRQHSVRVVPMSAVGLESEEDRE